MPYKAIWKYINIINFKEIENYRKGNKNEENNEIGWIVNLAMKNQKIGDFSRFIDIWLFLARNCFEKGFAPLLFFCNSYR